MTEAVRVVASDKVIKVITAGATRTGAGGAPVDNPTFTGTVTTPAGAAGAPGLRILPGVAPTAPANGDVWTTAAGMFVRVGGATIGPLVAGVTVQDENSNVVTGATQIDFQGNLVVASSGSGEAVVTVNGWSAAKITSDVANANATANTLADITGLSFAVTSGTYYAFKFFIRYDAAATTTGARFSLNGPAATFMAYSSYYPLTATTETINYGMTAYDLPAASNASSLVTGNIAVVEGVIQPSANGTVIGRFASEVSSSAITAKPGSHVQWRVI
jgi:hypothetical protein